MKHLNGKVKYQINPNITSSYREMIHQWNHEHRWMAFGCDLLLGVGADRKTDYQQQQFLPDSLRKDFASAVVVEPSGRTHKLVAATMYPLTPNNAEENSGFWTTVTPTILFAALFILTLIIACFEYHRKKIFWPYDTLLLAASGLAGIILFLMIFSEHPVRVNLQILLLNPLSIIFVFGVSRKAYKHQFHYYWKILFVCLILFLACGLFLQNYAEGMWLLACTLLVRCIINRLVLKPGTLIIEKGNKK